MLSHLSNTQKGILLALAGYTAFALSDICTKWLTHHYTNYQVVVMETGCATLIFLALSPWLGGLRSMSAKKDIKIHALRVALNIMINLMLVYCFARMPLANLYTLLFTVPFFAALLAIPLYKEAVRAQRWIAIVVGFVGVLVALRPDANMDLMMFLPLLCAALIALMFLVARSLEGASVFSLGFLPIIGSCLFTLPFMIPVFVPIVPAHLLVAATSAALMTIGFIGVSSAFRIAAAAAVSPFVYTQMIWAIVFGFLIFGDVPHIRTLAGAAIIIASGIYLLETERRNNAKPPVPVALDML